MSNMNFNCDVCGREVQGCTLVNGMKFCAKCYQETFGETDKDKQIAELQKQLEEKEKKIEDLKKSKQYFIMNYNHIIDKLQKQLESQPAEIVEKIKEFVEGNAYYYEEEQYAEHIIKYLDDILKEYQK